MGWQQWDGRLSTGVVETPLIRAASDSTVEVWNKGKKKKKRGNSWVPIYGHCCSPWPKDDRPTNSNSHRRTHWQRGRLWPSVWPPMISSNSIASWLGWAGHSLAMATFSRPWAGWAGKPRRFVAGWICGYPWRQRRRASEGRGEFGEFDEIVPMNLSLMSWILVKLWNGHFLSTAICKQSILLWASTQLPHRPVRGSKMDGLPIGDGNNQSSFIAI